MINQARIAIIAAALSFGLSGCATIVEGNTDNVAVTSVPVDGAKCELKNGVGTWYVTTPGSLQVRKSKTNLEVTCRRDGYQDAHQSVESKFEGMTAGNLLFGGVVGVGVDAASGAMNHYPASLQIALYPSDASAALPTPTPSDAAPSAKPVTTEAVASRDTPVAPSTQTAKRELHVGQAIGYKAVNSDPALQDYLSRTMGVSLNSDAGSASGLMATNTKGSVLAEKKYPYGSDPGSVQLVSIADDDGWWREPNARNAVVLIEMLNTDKDSRWRIAAANALGNVGTAPVVKALKSAADKDTDESVRSAARDAIKSAGGNK
jgi:hypothetical protein